jgi:signal transduction histidine kinase
MKINWKRFERFIQADICNEKALQGTGLGLAISKDYMSKPINREDLLDLLHKYFHK